MIVDEAGAVVYSPPDFLLPLRSREGLKVLAERMTANNHIEEIMAFEARMNRRAQRRTFGQ